MFDLFSKISEAKKRIEQVKEALANKEFIVSDHQGYVTVIASATKDIKSIKLSDQFNTLAKEQAASVIQETVNNALKQAETYAKEEMRKATDGLIPNIPGLNLFG
ncbi:MAG: YbaB/EbfC family nucleoid-associated protein [Bacteroidetes bacterium]|nr:YbaB/EbfC family nucleoid-associated protein [Bacteroidota bacterium]